MIAKAPTAANDNPRHSSLRAVLQDWAPRLVLAPSFLLIVVFVYGFNLWTLFLSFTNAKAFTSTKLIGLANYQKMWTWTFETDPPSNWYTALINMGLFGGLYVGFCLALGLGLAILLAHKIRGEGHFATNLSLSACALLYRDRHGVEVVLTRASASRRRCMIGAGPASISIGSSIPA